MDNKNFKNHIKEILKKDNRLWYEEEHENGTKTTELNQTKLIDLAERYDENILKILFDDKKCCEKFFVKIGENYVFKNRDFQFFLEENKIDNSYTKYKNRIGLSDGKRFLKENKEVVLNFPFKDCVLEGGQSTEEGTDNYFEKDKQNDYQEKQTKRKEIFFNEILAADEIDRLTDEKALVNFKRFSKESEKKLTEIKRDKNGTIKENLIIKGNNFLALHCLKKQFAKKVKLIYIDPPYNTGNDGFKYNDNFNHSTWLTFMKNRLEVARKLLKDDGVIFVQCDDNEQAYLKILMDEVFGRENFICNMVREAKTGSGHDSQFLAVEYDYILVSGKNIENIKFNKQKLDTNNDKKYKHTDKHLKKRGKYYLRDFDYKGSYSKSLDYPIELDDGMQLFAGGTQGEPNTWRWSKEKFDWGKQNDFIVIDNEKEKVYIKQYQFVDNQDNFREREIPYRALIKFLNTQGTRQIASLQNDFSFSFPKSEQLIQYIIEISTQKGDLILDYHLGSGTTATVAHKMGRQYIGIEQMDYIENIAVERLKKVIDGEQGGISKAVKWQGGGSFLYCELAKWNEKAKEKINACESLEELKSFFSELADKYFLNYNLKIKEFEEKVLEEENFINLSLEKQKEMFCVMLDNNQMYVNRSEMEDEKFGIGEGDREITREFYK